jgi:hypothetical protein
MMHLLVRHRVADAISPELPDAKAASGILGPADLYFLNPG